MSCPEYDPAARQTLLGVARKAIDLGLDSHGAIDASVVVDIDGLQPQLREPRATFITLRKFAALRGCTGSLEPRRPLVEDVAENACHTAFDDPRFPQLVRAELDDVRVEISILSPLSEMRVSSERDLLDRLNPVMGLVIESAGRRGTFLPKVWESLPDPAEFLAELKHKAGIPVGSWPDDVRVLRYHTETFAEGSALP
ncbi:MAG: AmmeMemoRadiSam system protein A [Gammaproteobacteria bacterium]|nr:AmmeMemoRadiSam system protein A [Gammaproteobacteria bacterium]